MTDSLIQVEGLSKKFCRSLKRSLWYGLHDIGSELRGGQRNNTNELRAEEFWSVKDISFEVNRGDCLALIGPNGAGKSTLLRMLNGLIKPDQGQITMRGRINALIALGAGFNPVLTGKENVYVNGSVLGFTKKEIDEKYETIVEFSELRDFMDTPVRNYSSGMNVRLGFAVAAQMEPDVLLLDEVLAVGDAGFRAKCFNTIMDIMQHAAVIFVSHSMPQIARVASKVLVMEHGRCILQTSDVGKAMETYYSTFTQCEAQQQISGNGKSTPRWIRLEDLSGNQINKVAFAAPFNVSCGLAIDPGIKEYRVQLDIRSREQQLVLQFSSEMDGVAFNKTGDVVVKVGINAMRLSPGQYVMNLFVADAQTHEVLLAFRECLSFEVTGNIVGYAPVSQSGDWTLEPAR
ncbi:MAG: ABC transporter ATP-binding protein [Pseudomonadota bacterium]|nr:ABC transporter ATP-binding protein [Pseudomonadota bacterium]